MSAGVAANPPIPRLIAHRGYASKYPENSREGLAAAVDIGARYIEFDIQLTHDHVPILLHDDDFARTAGLKRSVFDLDAAELSAIDVNESKRFGDRFNDIQVPLLAQVVADLERWTDVTAFVELKRQSLAKFGAEIMVAKVLEQLEPVLDRCVVISFIQDGIVEARRRSEVRIGWVTKKWTVASYESATALAPDYLFCKQTILPAGESPVWPGPWTWACYGVSDWPRALELAGRGVDMISTFEVGELLDAKRAAGVAS